MMNQRQVLSTAAMMGALAVSIGAFGAHALKPMLTASGRLDVFETAVRYHFYHTLAMLAAGILMSHYPVAKLRSAAILFLAGIIFFSGSLYLLCFTALGWFGAITPIGGLLLIAGWILLLLGVRQK